MSDRILFSGQAVRAEMIVMLLEKWGLHARLEETSDTPHLDDLERDARVLIGTTEYDRAREILWGESEIERAGF